MKLITTVASFLVLSALVACAVDAPDPDTEVDTLLVTDDRELSSRPLDAVVADPDAADAADASDDVRDADSLAGPGSKKCEVIAGDCTCPAADAGWKLQTGLCYESVLTCGRQGFCTYVRDH